MSVVLESQGSLYAPRKVGVLNSKEFVTLTEGEEEKQALEPAFLLSQADAEEYLHDIWFDNRSKEAAELPLWWHTKRLVGEWSSKLTRFEEEVTRRQESSLYAKTLEARRQELQTASGSLTSRGHRHISTTDLHRLPTPCQLLLTLR